ncbi:trypsin-like peptidase domain-containing protein [Alteromonas sp. ZYF713]|nr:trypsin-like peptidase domain-containing protein [Alteromonas sp. ZYF713]
MYKDIYNKIDKSCCYITVFLGDDKMSEGTGFSLNEQGQVITAGHVITGRFPLLESDIKDPEVKILVKFPNIEVQEYRIVFCGFTIQCSGFTDDLQLDIAVIHPKKATNIKFPFLVTVPSAPELGDEVFLAGFSEELVVSFGLDRLMNENSGGVKEFKEAMNKGFIADMMGPLIKRSVIGNIRKLISKNSALDLRVETASFYADNGMHPGASGGPVVNRKGEAVGVITQRAITSASQSSDTELKVPAGSTVCLSLECLPVANQLIKMNSEQTLQQRT